MNPIYLLENKITGIFREFVSNTLELLCDCNTERLMKKFATLPGKIVRGTWSLTALAEKANPVMLEVQRLGISNVSATESDAFWFARNLTKVLLKVAREHENYSFWMQEQKQKRRR